MLFCVRRLAVLFLGAASFLLVPDEPALAGPESWSGGGPDGGTASDLVADPTLDGRVFAATGSGVYVSTDDGETWSPTGILEGGDASLLSIADDGTLYAASFFGPVVRSGDAGVTWQTRNGTLGESILSLATAPTDQARVLVGTNEGAFWSDDAGSSYAASTGLPASTRVEAVVFSPFSAMVAFAGTSIGVYKSTDGGQSWTASSTGIGTLGLRDVLPDPTDSLVVYALTNTNALFRSVDAGVTWTMPTATGLGSSLLFDLAISPDAAILAVASQSAVYLSEDDAASFSTAAAPGGTPLKGLVSRDLSARGAAERYILTNGERGLLRSEDDGVSWLDSWQGLGTWACNVFWTSSDRWQEVFCEGVQSLDGLGTWNAVPFEPGRLRVFAGSSSLSSPAVAYAIQEDEIFQSTNRGATWSARITDPASYGGFGPLLWSVAVHPTKDDQLLLGNFATGISTGASGPGMLFSADGGETASEFLKVPLDPGDSFLAVDPFFHPTDPLVAFVGADMRLGGVDRFRVYRTEDAGALWSHVEFLGARFGELVMSPADPNVLYVMLYTDGDPDFVRSTDGGVTFGAPASPPPPCTGRVTASPSDADEVFVACGELYRSTDAGATWEPIPRVGLPARADRFNQVLVFDDPRRYVARTNFGVFEYTEWLFGDGFESGDLGAWTP